MSKLGTLQERQNQGPKPLTQDLESFHAQLIDEALELAIKEDLGQSGKDITTDAIAREGAVARGYLLAKQQGVIAGLGIFHQVFAKYDPSIQITDLVQEGDYIEGIPYKLALFDGPARSILKAERVALNLLQRMSGIATQTRKFVSLAEPHGIAILDTRKTTPGLRAFEKQAVALAGGTNHRFGLFDAVLIKDNHVRLAGGISQAIKLARQSNQCAIEVETTTLDEVREAIEQKAERIMLDNMTPDMVKKSVEIIAGRAYVEVSGGINASNIEPYFIKGVNAISMGALTHSAPNIDISLEVETLT